jgi:K+ transporter
VADPTTVPQALLHNLKHNQVLHERNVILTVRLPRRALGADGGARGRCNRWATASGA